MTEPLLVVRDLCLDIRRQGRAIPILRNVSFELNPGERKGIAGESGAGKSMTMHCVTSLVPRNIYDIRGEILFRNEDGKYTDALRLPWARRQRFCADRISLIGGNSSTGELSLRHSCLYNIQIYWYIKEDVNGAHG